MHAYVTVGISASGKSTFAAEMVKKGYHEVNRDWIRFNIVQPGANWSNYKWKNEEEVTKIHGQMIMNIWGMMGNIVVSDTNLNAGRRNQLVQHLTDLGYEVEIKTFDVSREEAIKRDNLRANGVGESVIYQQNLQLLDFKGRRTYTPDPNKVPAIIVDVDGTIATMNGRGAFEWKKVGQDLPRHFIIDMVNNYCEQTMCEMIVCSGRSDECHEETWEWLVENGVFFDKLFMRQAGDFRKDNAVKEEIFWRDIEPRYNVLACVDDRPQMIRLWHELRIPNVIAVADPYKEF